MSEEEAVKILQYKVNNVNNDVYIGELDKQNIEAIKVLLKFIEQLQQQNEELKRKLNWIAFGDDSELALRYLRKIGYVDFDDERKYYINKHNNEPFFLDEEEEKKYYLKDEELDEYTKQLEQKNKEYQETYKDVREEIKDYKHQLEEKDKIIDEAIEYINQQIFDMTVVGNGTLSLDRLLEILERGKNGKLIK